ncbi:ABC transporter ATP-binding protein [Enterovirga rhinocerotis]|uniref:ABC transporter ATP-binding protein n=1 Tax=Enterovirga rhinocerotis TaxID=1339210 RepID=UPI001FDEC516|nr:ABC transporter ATP-binding protein [Enterovirga rhinocerotis]
MTTSSQASVGAEQSPAGETAVSLQGITKAFGGVTVLEPTTLDIRKGEFFSLLGPSGCGKTTLLRIIGGFEHPSGGELLIGGQPMLGTQPYDRRTNMVFQHGALFPHLTVAENIAFGLEMSRKPRGAIDRKVAEALDLVRLDGFGARRIDQLSGGQRQRVAMARALVNEPEVLLLDEPLGALDLKLRLQMQDELKRLHRAIGGTFIFVTHDQGEAISMSDRIAVMSRGVIQQVGSPRDVYEKPANRFVAEFMGHSNFYTGQVGRREDGAGEVIVNGRPFPCTIPPGFAVGAPVFVALRYERVEVAPPDDPGFGLDGTLVEEAYLGPTVQRTIDLGEIGLIVSDTANNGRERAMAPGSRVRVRWLADSPTLLAP